MAAYFLKKFSKNSQQMNW